MKVIAYCKNGEYYWHFSLRKEKLLIIRDDIFIQWINQRYKNDVYKKIYDGIVLQWHCEEFAKAILNYEGEIK